MKINHEDLIEQFKEICSNCCYHKPISTTKPFGEILQYKLKFKNQFQRGVLIENLLIDKILMMNETKALHLLDGYILKDIYKINNGYPICGSLSSLSIFKSPYTSKRNFKHEDINIESPEIFKAKYRCLTQPKIETCCIDLIIDDTIIDVKTDIDTKHLKKYVRQVFVQAIQFASFLISPKQYNSKFHDLNMEMIERPINNVGVFFWRLNEYYQYSIREMLTDEDLDKIVNIYTLLRSTYGEDLRLLAKKHLFSC